MSELTLKTERVTTSTNRWVILIKKVRNRYTNAKTSTY